jgi:hypothetical protein
MPVTPNIALNVPPIGSNNWGGPLNFNFALLDQIFGGTKSVPNFRVSGNVTVGGTITAGSFSGLDGSFFLTSALYDAANGIPQLNAAGKIPASLVASLGLVVVPFSATPTFNANNAQGFKIMLTGNVTSSTFANGVTGPALVIFRFLQDATGGWTFTWPANVRNPGVVSPNPNARSVQVFALDSDGSLDAVGPIQYS